MLCQHVRFGTHNKVKLGKSVISTQHTLYIRNDSKIDRGVNFAGISTPDMTPGRGTWQHFANFYSFPSEGYAGVKDPFAHAQQRTFRSSKGPVSYSVVIQVECSSFLDVVNFFTHIRAYFASIAAYFLASATANASFLYNIPMALMLVFRSVMT